MMNRQWLLPAALALGAIILVAVWFSGPSSKAPEVKTLPSAAEDIATLSLLWRTGVAQQYRVLSDSSMKMQDTGKGPSSINVHVQGLLDMLTLESTGQSTGESTGDYALVGMRFSSLELKINDQMDTATNLALGVPFKVRFAANGMPLAFEFPAEVSDQNRKILESLVRTFQVSLDRGDNWVTQEANSSGSYDAAYRRIGPSSFEKSKRRFTAAAGMVSWSEVSSTESFSIDAGYNWLAAMEVQETMRSDGQGGPAMTVTNQASLTLQAGVQLAVTPDLWQFDASDAPATAAKLRDTVPDLTAEEAHKEILATVPDLDAATQGRLGLIHRLRDLVRVDDALPGLILDVMKTQELSDRTRADLYLVLELAGSESAQAALVEVITDSSWSLKDGMRAIVAMGGVKQPTVESIASMWDAALNSSDDERQRMADSATFALGSIGNTLNKVDDPEYQSLRSALLSSAQGASDVNQRSNFITALGNTHDTTLAPEVAGMLNDAEPAVRRAAALSLGTLGIDQVADTVMTQYNQEDNGYVRGAMAESLQSWTQPTDSAMQTFRQTVQTEADERTRYNIAVMLGKNLDSFPENEAVLREIMRSESSKRIRQKVADALATN